MRILLALVAAVAPMPSITKLILRPAQVGPGYVLLQRPDSVGVVNTVTLNLCGAQGYPSESLRTARLQLDYKVRRGGTMELSNEVVAYKPGGARQAMQEVRRHALQCPTTPIDTGQQGLPPLTVTITPIKDPALLKGYVAVRVRLTGTVKGKHVDGISFAVYQRFGNVLSGTYSFAVVPNTSERQQERFILQAAEQSAVNLRFGGPPSGPIA